MSELEVGTYVKVLACIIDGLSLDGQLGKIVETSGNQANVAFDTPMTLNYSTIETWWIETEYLLPVDPGAIEKRSDPGVGDHVVIQPCTIDGLELSRKEPVTGKVISVTLRRARVRFDQLQRLGNGTLTMGEWWIPLGFISKMDEYHQKTLWPE